MNKCLNCNGNTYNPKFCCRSCSATYNNKNNPKRKLRKKCATCGELTYSQRKYCKNCSMPQAERWSSIVEQTGYFHENGKPGCTKPVRKYLIRKHGNKCMICNQSGDDWQGKPITLIVDHIDGDAHNWNISNIQIVCPNCDSQLPTFKGRNVGNSTRKYTITQK